MAAVGDKSRFLSKAGKKKWVRPSQMRVFSREEVARHNTADDCWLIIRGKVYDVTTYVPDHPGDMKIASKAGLDNTEGFYGEQHGQSVFEQVEEYRIGELEK